MERENLLTDFQNHKTEHKGAIILKQTKDGEIQMSIQQNSTSKETIEVNNIVANEIKKSLRGKSIIGVKDDFISVRFNDFNNASRIRFFYSFKSDFCIYLKFNSITDIDLYLDQDVESHADVKKFLDEIDSLKMNGKGLQKHHLLKSSKYYDKLIFGSIKLKYKLEYRDIRGYATVSLSFPDYIKKKSEDSELQVAIDFVLDQPHKGVKNENEIRRKILNMIEPQKVKSYRKYKT